MIILNSIAVLTTERNKANGDVTTSKNNSKIFVTRTVTEKYISKKILHSLYQSLVEHFSLILEDKIHDVYTHFPGHCHYGWLSFQVSFTYFGHLYGH
jgi:hypothetical protein